MRKESSTHIEFCCRSNVCPVGQKKHLFCEICFENELALSLFPSLHCLFPSITANIFSFAQHLVKIVQSQARECHLHFFQAHCLFISLSASFSVRLALCEAYRGKEHIHRHSQNVCMQYECCSDEDVCLVQPKCIRSCM